MTGPHVESLHVRARGVTYHVLALGQGTPVVLLHGFPENRNSFSTLAPALAASGYRVYVPDLKGYGLTEKPKLGSPHGDYRLSVVSEEIGVLIGALGLERAHVVGHDWGGLILSAMMATARSVIDRAVLMNAPFRRFAPWAPRHVYFFNLPDLPERRFWRAPVAFVQGIIDAWSARPEVFDETDVRQYTRELQRDGSIHCAFAYYRSLPRDLPFIGRALLGGLGEPPPKTLVLFGEADPIMPPMVARWAHADLPGSELLLVPGAGHFVHREAPDVVNAAVLRFLGGP